jgi:hypothetical protein
MPREVDDLEELDLDEKKVLNLDLTLKQLQYIRDIGEERVKSPIRPQDFGVQGRKICTPYYIEYRIGYKCSDLKHTYLLRVEYLLNLADQAEVLDLIPVMHITWEDGGQSFLIPEDHCWPLIPPSIRKKFFGGMNRRIQVIPPKYFRIKRSARRIKDPTGRRWVLLSPTELREWTGIILPTPNIKINSKGA